MTIDERLEFLLHSTESLHASCQQLHAAAAEHTRQMEASDARQKAAEAKEARLRLALLQGIQTFLQSMNGNEGEPE